MSTGQQYRAKYDFKATAAGMLSFKCGEHFSLISKTNEGWWTVRSASGDSGLVPVNYVEPVEIRNGGPTKSVAYTALYDYTGQGERQLSFKQAETLTLVDKTDVSWWMMSSSSGQQGLVPVNYIDKLDTDQELKATQSIPPPSSSSSSSSSSREPASPGMEPAALSQVLQSIDNAIQKIHDESIIRGGMFSAEQQAALQRLVNHRKQIIDSAKTASITTTVNSASTAAGQSPARQPGSPSKSPGSSPSARRRLTPTGSPTRVHRQAPPPPSPQSGSKVTNDASTRESKLGGASSRDNQLSLQVDWSNGSDDHRPRFGSLPRRPAPAPPKRRDSIDSGSGTPPKRSSTMSASSSRHYHQQGSSSQHPPPLNTSFDSLTVQSPSLLNARRHSTDVVLASSSSSSSSAKKTTQQPRNLRTHSVSPQHSPLQKKRSTSSGSVSPRKRNSSSSPGSPRKSLEALGGGDSSPGKEERVRLPTEFPASAGTELVEGVRTRTGMSYKKSLQAVSSVLEFLKSKVPVCSEMVDGLFIAVQHSQTQNSPSSSRKADRSHDVKRLKDIFFELTECKDDSQQRGWAVHDDQEAIVEQLEELLQILCDGDPDVTKVPVQEDKYENVLTLITYYQMEPRIPIRLLLLKVFGVLCALDRTVISVLLTSVLPNELGRDVQQNLTVDLQKTLYSCTVCSMIFSSAEAVPLPVYDQWSVEYVGFLLETVEEPPAEDDEEDALPDAFINMILSFNQHFQDPATNLVMKALREQANPRNFSEKMMHLINRGEDPVAITEPCCPDSMTKFLLDIFSDASTSGLFYTTDMMVLIDIVTRQLADLSQGDEARPHNLELLFRIISSTDYADHCHRQKDLERCLNRIAHEENSVGTRDHAIVQKIHAKFPGIFEAITDL